MQPSQTPGPARRAACPAVLGPFAQPHRGNRLGGTTLTGDARAAHKTVPRYADPYSKKEAAAATSKLGRSERADGELHPGRSTSTVSGKVNYLMPTSADRLNLGPDQSQCQWASKMSRRGRAAGRAARIRALPPAKMSGRPRAQHPCRSTGYCPTRNQAERRTRTGYLQGGPADEVQAHGHARGGF